MPGRGRKTARACVPPPPEEPSCRAVAAAARSRDGHRESAGRTMQSLDNTGADELQEPGRPLTDDKPPGASEEPAAAEAAGTPPGPGWCWLCRSSPCASRVQPGELGVRTGVRDSPLEESGGRPRGDLHSCRLGRIADRAPHPHRIQRSEKPGAVTWGAGQQSRSTLSPPARKPEKVSDCVIVFRAHLGF